MVLTYKYRIYPNRKQQFWLFHILEHLKDLHNSARLNRIRAYEEEGVFVSYIEQNKILTQARAKHQDFREIPQDFQNRVYSENTLKTCHVRNLAVIAGKNNNIYSPDTMNAHRKSEKILSVN